MITACFAGQLWAQHSSAVDAPRDVFARANAAFEAGEYEEAVEGYRQLERAGAVDADLYYNLGNAYYKMGALGYAVLYYERARELRPRDEDVRKNLSLVQSLLRDNQFVTGGSRARRAFTWVHRRSNTSEAAVLTSALYLLLCLTLLAFVFRASRHVSALYSRLSVLSPGRLLGLEKTADIAMAVVTVFVLLAASAGSTYAKYRTESDRRVGIVVTEEVPVYSGPTAGATLQFKIHEGTRVGIEEARTGWLQITLPGELSGWIETGTMERI